MINIKIFIKSDKIYYLNEKFGVIAELILLHTSN